MKPAFATTLVAFLILGCVPDQKSAENPKPVVENPPQSKPVAKNPGPEQKEPKPLPIPINAIPITNSDLWQAFRSNPFDAHTKYHGKYIAVKGRVKSFSQENGKWVLGFVAGEPGAVSPATLARMSAKERSWWTNGYPPNVICSMAAGEENNVPKSEGKGNPIATIVGKCTGSKDADAVGGFIVEMVDARFTDER